MTDRGIIDGNPQRGDYVVRGPRLGDAVGQTLKTIYGTHGKSLPDDMKALLTRLDGIAIH